ncbi:MAG TPA: prepilin-type N-terminal cleavage/methylation domain-containing protein [Terriglobales bacterium]|nr:prepilin-type N-terminal cleavage/methylation domain-containing protein [Terriglobales bacterium]
MATAHEQRGRGFTLLELMISMALGLVILAAATQMFTKAMSATWTVTQRAGMQQDGRAAIGLIAKDISLAGAGMPTGGVQLPTGTGLSPIYGCDQTKCYIGGVNGTGVAYPQQHLYGVVPGYQMGRPMTNGGAATDTITVVYTDITYSLNLYTVTNISASGNSITVTPPNPQPNPPVPPITDQVHGVKVGDLILITNTAGNAIGEVTGIVGTTVINFADRDPLNINQSLASAGNIKAIAGACNPVCNGTTATRIQVVTYYLDLPPGPDGIRYTADDWAPRLMRQVNGQTPVPVAENINNLQFTYDIFDVGTAIANLPDAGYSQGKSLNEIRKVNVLSLTARSAMHGSGGYQGLDLATSISVRDMSFKDRYQ